MSDNEKRPADGSEDKTALLTEMNRLREENERKEAEKRSAEAELFKSKKEVRELKAEIERMRSPYLMLGTVRDVLGNNRAVVRTTTGFDIIVSVSDFIPKGSLVPGSVVSMNAKTFAVMDVLPSPPVPIATGSATDESTPMGRFVKDVLRSLEEFEMSIIERTRNIYGSQTAHTREQQEKTADARTQEREQNVQKEDE